MNDDVILSPDGSMPQIKDIFLRWRNLIPITEEESYILQKNATQNYMNDDPELYPYKFLKSGILHENIVACEYEYFSNLEGYPFNEAQDKELKKLKEDLFCVSRGFQCAFADWYLKSILSSEEFESIIQDDHCHGWKFKDIIYYSFTYYDPKKKG